MRVLSVLLLILGLAFGKASAGLQGPCRPQPASAVPPPLTRSQCVEAAKIVAADEYLRKLLAGVKHTIERPDPWGSNDGVHNIGAVLKIQLARKLDVARTNLRVADFASQNSDAYTAEHLAVSIHGATQLRVFVDFSRHRVVWVMPWPPDSEGPPPTSIPPYTLPVGFVLGTGGTTPSDAANGLALHLVTFDGTGRLQQEEWADPVTGKAVTNVYDAERKLRVTMSSVLAGRTLRVTTVDYTRHTWTSGSGSLGTDPAQILALDSRTLPARIRGEVSNQVVVPGGNETVEGIDALRLQGTTGIAYWGFSFVGGKGNLWVDPSTYLPVQETIENPSTGAVEVKTFFSWGPRTGARIASTSFAIPTGFKHTPSTGLPHIFGD